MFRISTGRNFRNLSWLFTATCPYWQVAVLMPTWKYIIRIKRPGQKSFSLKWNTPDLVQFTKSGVFFIFSFNNIVRPATNFLIFTTIRAKPISLETFSFPRTENLPKPKLAFRFPNTGSTSIFLLQYIDAVFSSESFSLIYAFCFSQWIFTLIWRFFPSFAFVQALLYGQFLDVF